MILPRTHNDLDQPSAGAAARPLRIGPKAVDMQDGVSGDEHPESPGSGDNDAPATVDGNAEMPSVRATDTSKRRTSGAAHGLALVQLAGGSTFKPAAIGNSSDFAAGAAATSVSTSSTGKALYPLHRQRGHHAFQRCRRRSDPHRADAEFGPVHPRPERRRSAGQPVRPGSGQAP